MIELSTLCYVRQDGKTLMLLRNKKENDVHSGKWNGLGGKFLLHESPEECVIREVKEESGLELFQPRLHGVMTFPEFEPDVNCTVFLFSATEFSGSLIESPEGHLEWINDDDLLSLNLWEGDKVFLPWLEKPGFFSAKFIYKNGIYISHKVQFYNN